MSANNEIMADTEMSAETEMLADTERCQKSRYQYRNQHFCQNVGRYRKVGWYWTSSKVPIPIPKLTFRPKCRPLQIPKMKFSFRQSLRSRFKKWIAFPIPKSRHEQVFLSFFPYFFISCFLSCLFSFLFFFFLFFFLLVCFLSFFFSFLLVCFLSILQSFILSTIEAFSGWKNISK